MVLGIVAPLASLLTGFAAASLSFTAWSVKAEGARTRKGGEERGGLGWGRRGEGERREEDSEMEMGTGERD